MVAMIQRAPTQVPAGLTRVSPGVYRNGAGQTVQWSGGSQQPAPTGQTPAQPQSLDARIAQLELEIAKRGGNAPNRQAQLQTLLTQKGNNQTQNPVISHPAIVPGSQNPTPPPTDTSQPSTPTTPAQPTGNPTDISNALFPNIRAFEPSNYLGSPLYQFQQQQGQKALDRLYAARGLTGSGAEVGGNVQFLNQLGAQEADRAQNVAELEAQRLQNLQQTQFQNQENTGNDQFDRLYKILSLASQNSPLNIAATGVGASGDILGAQGGDLQKVLSDLYTRYQGPVGGGGQILPQFRPPFPSSPDFSASNIAGLLGGQQTGTSFINSLVSAAPSLISLFGG